jgi:hypothetical protein
MRWLLLAVVSACRFQPGHAVSIDSPSPTTCSDLTCDPHATCAMSDTGATCTCNPGYSGDGTTCQIIDPCAANNGGCAGACANVNGMASCYVPATCADVAAKVALANDTSVTLYVQGDVSMPWTAFCHGGLEYLTLPAGGSGNFGQYTAGGKSPGTDVRTQYTRIRLVPSTLVVDICDQTFATSTGSLQHDPNNIPGVIVSSMPLGSAMDCAGSNSHTGVAQVDVTGTPFAVTASWSPGGNSPGGAVTSSNAGRTAAITGGGNCGWNAPTGSPGNPFNTFSSSKLLGLAYMP